MKNMLNNRKDGYQNSKALRPILKEGVEYVNEEEEDQMEIYGYKFHWFFNLLTWILIILTGGLLRLVLHWKPNWMLFFTHSLCPLESADKVLLVDQYNQSYVETLNAITNELTYGYHEDKSDPLNIPERDVLNPKLYGTFELTKSLVIFENKKLRYMWDHTLKKFVKIKGLDQNIPCTYFYKQVGLTAAEQEKRLIHFGSNEIAIKVQSVFQVLYNEVLTPFYVFQVFSVILWCFEDYIYYASAIVIMSAGSLASAVVNTRRNQKQLRDMVQDVERATVCRGDEVYEEIETTKLVPGDVIVVPAHGCILQYDAVLINGHVIINESMLTGESVPVTKTPLPYNPANDANYDPKEHGKHTLFCGTKVILTRNYVKAKVKAVVIRTGFLTSKGELVRSMMFPKPVDFKFNRHIHLFISVLGGLAVIGFIYTLILKIDRKETVKAIVLKALDLITIIVPPALPAALTFGTVFAQSRLRKLNIFCTSPRSINMSGCINCVCFDKTGTLTEDDLSFSVVIPVDKSNKFGLPIQSPSQLESGPLITAMATCHSLTIIDGSIIGDPLDQKMFEATQWILKEPGPGVSDENKFDLLEPPSVRPRSEGPDNNIEVGILRQFTFSSSLQRMSVITRLLGDNQYIVYTKGAPETIASLCIQTTIPESFTELLKEYTEKGCRVLALAYRPISNLTYAKVHRAIRDDIEKDLTFLGLLVMDNMLKPETSFTIESLKAANIRVIMVTGDNMLTALSVAKECNMIYPNEKVVTLVVDHSINSDKPSLKWSYDNTKQRENIPNIDANIFVERDETVHVIVCGEIFEILKEHYPDLFMKIAVRGTVFGRMAPEQKQQLIEILQDLGYYVGMCGDGANDCGALKAAHAGVSLSDAEASVAAPFTSKNPDISCIPNLIKEGRAALVTAFGIIKYMACYSMAQFISVIILYTLYTNLTDMQFLYEDLFLISVFFTLFVRTKSYGVLAKSPPPCSLIGITPLSSLAFQVLLIIVFQVSASIILWNQSWYKPHHPKDATDLLCHDNYAIFAVSVFQYITLAIVFSKGAPYRKPIYTNYGFSLSLVIMTALTVYLVVYPAKWMAKMFELDVVDVKINFRFIMVGLAFLHLICSFICETFIVDKFVFKKIRATHWYKSLTTEPRYKIIDVETRNNTNWLPNSRTAMDNEIDENTKIDVHV